jgi:IS30 family transposase
MYKYLSRIKRYQIHSLLKANQTISEIARLLGRHRSTISRELDRGRGQRGYRAEQSCSKASERAQRCRNATTEWTQRSGLMWLPSLGFNGAPISERPSHIEGRKQVGHREGDTVIGAAHKHAIVTLVERKSGFALLAKVSNKTADLVGRAIEAKLMPLN